MDTYSILVNVLTSEYAIRLSNISPDKRLRGDLGIDGDDAFEFFERIQYLIDSDIAIDLESVFYGEGMIQRRTARDIILREICDLIDQSSLK